MGRAKTDVETAERVLADAEATVARWEAEAVAAGAEHASLVERSGDDVLGDPASSGRIADEMQRTAARMLLAGNAAAAAVRRVDPARRGVLEARATELRTRAAKMRTVIAVRQKRTDRLVEELRRHEGCDFVPFTPASTFGMPGAAPVTYSRPWSAVAADRAAGLDKAADELEQLAADGTAEQVSAAVGRALPEPAPVESLPAEGVLTRA